MVELHPDFERVYSGYPFVSHISREVGVRRWEEARLVHGLDVISDVVEHPTTMSGIHYVTNKQGRVLRGFDQLAPVPVDRWVPVGSCIFDTYGDYFYRVRILFGLPGFSFDGTYSEAHRRLSKPYQKSILSRIDMVDFKAVNDGAGFQRFSKTGRKERLAIEHEVLGFEIVSQQKPSLWCPEGLLQVRTVMDEINGNGFLVDDASGQLGFDLVNEAEYQRLVSRDFDRGEMVF